MRQEVPDSSAITEQSQRFRRPQFSIRRGLVMVAVFAVAAAWSRSLPLGAMAALFLSAAAISGVVALATRQNLPGILGALFCGLVGAALGFTALWKLILSGIQPARAITDSSGAIFCAICGTCIACLVGEAVRSQLHRATGGRGAST